MDIGKPQKTITITPLELPIPPQRAPQEQPQQPIQAPPERERVTTVPA